jgi:hypothetical protein
MNKTATGTFDVVLKPLPATEHPANVSLGRMSLDKNFVGDLVAIGQGDMLTAMTATKGSAGYVAIERITGTLHGRNGTFVFQHTGTMSRGVDQLSITVVPDSGTDELLGLAGNFTIKIIDGKHFYDFTYSLP